MARGGVWIGIIYFICFEGIGINHRKRFHSAEKQGKIIRLRLPASSILVRIRILYCHSDVHRTYKRHTVKIKYINTISLCDVDRVSPLSVLSVLSCS